MRRWSFPRWLLFSASLVGQVYETTSSSRRRKPKDHRPSIYQSFDTPVLLGLEPKSGPRDGGTRVVIRASGLNASLWNFSVSLRSVQAKGDIGQRSIKTIPVELREDEDELQFVVPDLRKEQSIGSGVLVSTSFWPNGYERHKARQTNPLFFRLLEELELLAPVWINPCCDFSISGGQTLLLAGSKRLAPDHHASIRFRGQEHEQIVDGQVVHGDWELNALSKNAPKDVWYVYVVTPPWPYAEEDVNIEISWNMQQFARFHSSANLVEDQSFFGEVAGHISEEHLAHAASHHSDVMRTELVSVLEGETDASPSNLHDLTHVMLLNHAGDAFILARSNDLTHLQEDIRIVHDIFTLSIAAMIGGVIATRIGMPTIIGFLIGGVIVGPGCGDMIVELVQVESIAELGICLLLFCLGLELTWDELFANAYAALAGLLSMGILCGIIVFVAAIFLQTSMNEAVCIGLFAALSSTPVTLKAMPAMPADDKTEKSSQNSGALMAILITQDIVLACMLAIMPIVFQKSVAVDVASPDTSASHVKTQLFLLESRWLRLTGMAFSLPCFISFACLCRHRRSAQSMSQAFRQILVNWITRMDPSLLVVVALGYVFAVAQLFENLGLSLELGAFVAGLMLTAFQAEIAKNVEHQLSSLRETFVAWFFASIGLVINPHFLYDNLRAILSVTMFLFVIKLVAGFLPLWIFSHRWRKASPKTLVEDALHMSWILANTSEFGFVLASKGTNWRVISRHVYLLLVGTNVVSLCLSPCLVYMWEHLQISNFSPPSSPVVQKAHVVASADVIGSVIHRLEASVE